MAVLWRIMIVAGVLWLGAALNGGVAARESAMPDDILSAIAEAGEAADRVEARGDAPLFERRAAAARLNASVMSALAKYPRRAGAILRTAMASAPRHGQFVAASVAAAFPGYADLARREANSAPAMPRPVRASATQVDPAAPAPLDSPGKTKREFGLSAIVIGAGGHDVGVFGRRKESGADVNIELRFTPFQGWLWDFLLSPEPHLGAHFNTDGNTNQLFIGGTWMFDLGWGVFAGGSLGFALHDGETQTNSLERKELGLPVLFRESGELGYRLGKAHSISLHLDHISNAGIDEKNEGLDTFGLRYTYRL